jgi:bifunctional non-homologous end joining protein LigD
MPLEEYTRKRRFDKTPEPPGMIGSGNQGRFVVQKHKASRLHYDFRLEHAGVLKSWAVPKGPSLNPADKHLAIMVEDHPLDYAGFEGIIPEGNYGAGQVMVWDSGEYRWAGPETGVEADRAMSEGLAKGHISIVLAGHKLQGEFALVRASRAGKDAWLLIKARDGGSNEHDVLLLDRSVVSGRTIEEITGPALEDAPLGPMPENAAPMLATPVAKPFDRAGWVYEIKYDGYRAIGQVAAGKVRLYSRNNKSLNEKFPAIASALTGLGHDAVLDGEVVALDEAGHPAFQLLQDYPKAENGELVYYVFDILWLDGHDLTTLPLFRRKQILRQIIPADSPVAYAADVAETGVKLFASAAASGLEGIVAKDASSPYLMGVRTRSWQKIKARLRQEVVIGGYTAPREGRRHFASLLAGVRKEGKLFFAGHVGTGFDEKALNMLAGRFKPLITKKCPFAVEPETNTPPTWLEPVLVAEVEFAEWTREGLMRQASFIGLRDDKPAADVVEEIPEGGPTHPDKVFWPSEGITKGDMYEYYRAVAPYILPHLLGRPESLHRFPNGLSDEGFWQKNMDEHTPDWIKTVQIASSGDEKKVNYMVCDDERSLLYMANLGCVEIHPWLSRVASLDNPDFAVIDLDPLDIGFAEVVSAALAARNILSEAGADAHCKTSGATGLHVFVPLKAGYSYEQARQFTELICVLINKQLPGSTSLARNPADRSGKVYLDYLQNRKGATVASVYSLRPRAGAPVSMPLRWSEVDKTLNPRDFNIGNVLDRIGQVGDLWAPGVFKPVSLEPVLDRLKSRV